SVQQVPGNTRINATSRGEKQRPRIRTDTHRSLTPASVDQHHTEVLQRRGIEAGDKIDSRSELQCRKGAHVAPGCGYLVRIARCRAGPAQLELAQSTCSRLVVSGCRMGLPLDVLCW